MLSRAPTAQTEETPCTPVCDTSVTLRLDAKAASRLAEAFKALGHPVRLQIVDLLSRYGGQVCVCEIERQFPLSQPTISHHLRVLREADLIDAESRGLWVYYHVQPQALTALAALLQGFGTAVAEGAQK